jgi:hypothetical protein
MNSKSNYSLSALSDKKDSWKANLIITALLPFFLSAKILIHLLRYLPNDNTLRSNLLISRFHVCNPT